MFYLLVIFPLGTLGTLAAYYVYRARPLDLRATGPRAGSSFEHLPIFCLSFTLYFPIYWKILH